MNLLFMAIDSLMTVPATQPYPFTSTILLLFFKLVSLFRHSSGGGGGGGSEFPLLPPDFPHRDLISSHLAQFSILFCFWLSLPPFFPSTKSLYFRDVIWLFTPQTTTTTTTDSSFWNQTKQAFHLPCAEFSLSLSLPLLWIIIRWGERELTKGFLHLSLPLRAPLNLSSSAFILLILLAPPPSCAHCLA